MPIIINPINTQNISFRKSEKQNNNEVKDKNNAEQMQSLNGYSSAYYLPPELTSRMTVRANTPTRPLYALMRDGFTNLKDKKCLLKDIENIKSEAISGEKNLQIAMFDMDNFKSINEILSYETGDIFIKRIADIIKKNAEENQLEAYRFGGEEFVIMTTGTSTDGLKEISTKIKDEIESDSILCSYKVKYASNLNERLSKLQEGNQLLQTIDTSRTQLDLLNELAKTDSSLLENATFKKKYDKTGENLRVFSRILLNRAIKKEKNPDTKLWLLKENNRLAKSDSKTNQSIFDNDKLYEYLDEKFNKRSDIYQIKKWLNDFNRNSFSITSGIADIDKSAFDNAAIELVNTAGEILKKGKSTQKGEVYVKNVNKLN